MLILAADLIKTEVIWKCHELLMRKNLNYLDLILFTWDTVPGDLNHARNPWHFPFTAYEIEVTFGLHVLAKCIDRQRNIFVALSRCSKRSSQVTMDSPHYFGDHFDGLQGRDICHPGATVFVCTAHTFLNTLPNIFLPAIPPISRHDFLNRLVPSRVLVNTIKNRIHFMLLNYPFPITREMAIADLKLLAYGQKVASSTWEDWRFIRRQFKCQYLAIQLCIHQQLLR